MHNWLVRIYEIEMEKTIQNPELSKVVNCAIGERVAWFVTLAPRLYSFMACDLLDDENVAIKKRCYTFTYFYYFYIHFEQN